jgi:hypothetical protein
MTDTRIPSNVLARNLRARQSAARCDAMAAAHDQRALRYPDGSALRADYAELAADYRRTAAQWRALVDEPADADGCPHDCDCIHDCDCTRCANDRALDDDADAYFDR